MSEAFEANAPLSERLEEGEGRDDRGRLELLEELHAELERALGRDLDEADQARR